MMITVLLTFSCLLKVVHPFSRGAPNNDLVCNDRLPHHHSSGNVIQPQNTTDIPYIISVNVTSVNYSDVVQITLSTKENDTFKGFVVQVLPVTDRLGFHDSGHVTNPVTDLHGITPFGTFIDSEGVKLLGCFGQINTATHKDGSQKRNATLYWKAPSADVFRHLIVKATILKEYSIYWKDVSSALILTPDARNNRNGDPAKSWLRMVSKTASIIKQGGGVKWADDIRSRLKHGFRDMGNSNEGVVTDYISNSLPFKEKFRNGKSANNNGLYRSQLNPKDQNLNINQLVTELLKGDFRFSDRTLKYLEGNR